MSLKINNGNKQVYLGTSIRDDTDENFIKFYRNCYIVDDNKQLQPFHFVHDNYKSSVNSYGNAITIPTSDLGNFTRNLMNSESIQHGIFQLTLPIYLRVSTEGGVSQDGSVVTPTSYGNLISSSNLINSDNGLLYYCREFVTDLRIPSQTYYSYTHNIYNISTIGPYALSYCNKLQTLYIPKSIKFMYTSSFEYTNEDCKIYYEGSEDDWNNIDITLDSQNGQTVLDSLYKNITFNYDRELKANLITPYIEIWTEDLLNEVDI